MDTKRALPLQIFPEEKTTIIGNITTFPQVLKLAGKGSSSCLKKVLTTF